MVFTLAMIFLLWANQHPAGASFSGALDQVLFDAASYALSRQSTHRVVIINIDQKTLNEMESAQIGFGYSTLLNQLTQAASVTLDMFLPPHLNDPDLPQAITRHGRVVLPVSMTRAQAQTVLTEAQPPWVPSQVGQGHRQLVLGHYGVVNGFKPYVVANENVNSHLLLAVSRASDMPLQHRHQSLAQYISSYPLSLVERVNAVLLLLQPRADIPQYSFVDVISGKIAWSEFENKVVFVGAPSWGQDSYKISSLASEELSGVQLDALMFDALASDRVAMQITSAGALFWYTVLLLGMFCVCWRTRGRWMHVAALAWFVFVLLFPMVLLILARTKFDLGVLPVACLLVYAFFAWQNLSQVLSLLHHEINHLHKMSSVHSTHHQALCPEASTNSDPVEEIRQAISDIRHCQHLYVEMINCMPYPLFMTSGGAMVVWNACADELLHTTPPPQTTGTPRQGSSTTSEVPPHGVTRDDVQRLVREHSQANAPTHHEVRLNGKRYILICVPHRNQGLTGPPSAHAPHRFREHSGMYATHSESSDGVVAAREQAETTTHFVCLMAMEDVQQGVMHDRQVLNQMAHDLRSPLTTIQALIEEHSSKLQSTPSAADARFLENLRKQTDYSLRVAEDFMHLSRAECLKKEMLAPLSLLDIAAEAVDQVWLAAQKKNIQIVGPQCETPHTVIQGNADMLVRALVNLLDNALKYSPDHTQIHVSLQKRPGSNQHKDWLELHIKDQGVGISADALQHMFEPFFQVTSSSNVLQAGVGLGLSYVQTVVERHGGRIEVSSEKHKGTTFTILFPLFQDV